MSEKRNSLQSLALKCTTIVAVAVSAGGTPTAGEGPAGTAFTYQGDLEEGGTPLDWDTPTFPLYEQTEANYYEDSYEPYLAEIIPEIGDAETDVTAGKPTTCPCQEIEEGGEGSGRRSFGDMARTAAASVVNRAPDILTHSVDVAHNALLALPLGVEFGRDPVFR